MFKNKLNLVQVVRRIENKKDGTTPIFKSESTDKICLLDKKNNETTTINIGDKATIWVRGRGKNVDFIKTDFEDESIQSFINNINKLTENDIKEIYRNEKGKFIRMIMKYDIGYNADPYINISTENLMELYDKILNKKLNKKYMDLLLALDYLYENFSQ